MTVYFSLPVGQSIRDFLDLGVIDCYIKQRPSDTIILLSPAYNVNEFIQKVNAENIVIERMESLSRRPELPFLLKVIRGISPKRFKKKWLSKLESYWYNPPEYLKKLWERSPADLIVCTHPMTSHEFDVFMFAKLHDITTLGVIKSWDNLRKGLTCLTDKISVWNGINCYEAITYNGYKEDEVTINGAVSFDPYFKSKGNTDKEIFIRGMGLDPQFPLITYATCGNYNISYYERDETYLLNDLIKMRESSTRLNNIQIIVRLHPVSRIEHFEKYTHIPFIKFSKGQYMPTIGWYTPPDNFQEQVRLLKYSDAVLTPASSWVLETAIFDTPCIVPVYSDLQPAHAKAQFDDFTLMNHFKPIVENNWAVISRSYNETMQCLIDVLDNPCLNSDQRKSLVENYIVFKDGNSAERVANWIIDSLPEKAQ
jgi:CDP-glycerol glycerophosphotransferase (TagB/SpsB family)